MESRNLFAIIFVVLRSFLSYTNAEFRILYGNTIRIKDSPHSVSIFNCGMYICTGSIISEDLVVTSAECVFGKDKGNLKVLSGVTDANDPYTRKRDVRDTIIGPGYIDSSLFMNIAIVKVAQHFRRQPNLEMPVTLCDTDTVLEPGTGSMQVRGWGGSLRGDHYRYLKNTTMHIIEKDQCMDDLEGAYSWWSSSDTIICAAGCDRSKLLYGDTGAGALVGNKLCAVALFTSNSDNMPDVFTDLRNQQVRQFLRDHTSLLL